MLNSLPNLSSLNVSAETIDFQDPVDLLYGIRDPHLREQSDFPVDGRALPGGRDD